jgi:hypothetical protein
MTAYELADELQDLHGLYCEEAANMLRQQAERIERKQELIREQTALLAKQNNRIAELEKSHIELEKGIVADLNKRQSAKPVAWMDYLEHSDVYDLNVSGRGIPLYTTPQIKELSDEEIKAIANNLTCTPDKNWNVLFAKAILRKAQEK